jgi:hypothetical protein
MKKDVINYVSTCLTCQKVKVEHKKVARLLQPLPVLEWKWEKVAMDFVTGLPLTQNKKDAIWVVVDRLTKLAHFIPANVRDSMEKLVSTYTQEVVRLQGVPQVLYQTEIRGLLRGFGSSSKSRWARP